MSTLNAPLPSEPIFHHAEPEFAHKLNQVLEAVREIQAHINGDGENDADEKLTPAQKRAKAKAEAEAAKAEEEAAAKAAADANPAQ